MYDGERVVAQFGGATREPRVAPFVAGAGQGEVRLVGPVLELETEGEEGASQVGRDVREPLTIALYSGPERARVSGPAEHAHALNSQQQRPVPTRDLADRVANRLHPVVWDVAEEDEGQVRGGPIGPSGAWGVRAHPRNGPAQRCGHHRSCVDGHKQALSH